MSVVYKVFIYFQESTDGHIPLVRKDSSLSNDVFESFESEEFSHPETVQEESSTALTTPTDERKTSMELGFAIIKLDKISQTEVAAIATLSPVHRKHLLKDSPDDGFGDSIARGSSLTDRSKFDSTEESDIAIETLKLEAGSKSNEKGIASKLSVDSAVIDDGSYVASPGPLTAVIMQDFQGHAIPENAGRERKESLTESGVRQSGVLKVEGAGVEHESLGLFSGFFLTSFSLSSH